MFRKIIEIKSKALGIVIGIIIGASLSLMGCGKSAEETADTTRVVESIDDEGNVVEEETVEKDTTDLAESEMVELNEEQQQVLRDVQTLDGGKDYLAYMSVDELKALAGEALAAAGKDTRITDGRLKTKGVVFDLPEGFEEDKDIKNFYVTSRYPIDASNVIYEETDVDYTLQLMEKGYFVELVKKLFAGAYKEDVDIDVTDFQEIKISGVPSFRIVTEYDLDGNHMIHLMYIINGSKTYCIVYTETADYDRMELFEESAKTIKVER